jgi:hypothetical protein
MASTIASRWVTWAKPEKPSTAQKRAVVIQ